MSFDYKKSHGSQQSDSFWTSYSDLFLGLSTIFLLLYVVSSLRTGTDAIKAQVENQKLTFKVEELEQQLKMYESVKSDYMNNQASKTEVEEYQELMDKLTLLQDEAKSEKNRLVAEAMQNQKKAQALNKYQQMVRNVLNANKLAKVKIDHREELIDDQDVKIDKLKQTEIRDLGTDVAQKELKIKQNQARIARAESERDQSQKKLLAAFKANQLTKAQYQQRLQALRGQARREITTLQNENSQFQAQIKDLGQEIGSLKAAHAEEVKRARAALDAEIKRGALSAAQRAAREKAFRDKVANEQRQLGHKIAGLEGALAKAKEEIDTRRAVAREIKSGFERAGIRADVNMETGEVVLDFGNHYFDSDSANLKREMKEIIEKAMPVYSRSLFGNRKVAEKISAVEVVGFASPTYRGRFVDPRSQTPEDKEALKYNMDLSYQRANSIFSHLLENQNLAFDHQKDLMALMKASGRSFLEVMKVPKRAPASAQEFCRMNDCKKAQRVIVRFSMDGK